MRYQKIGSESGTNTMNAIMYSFGLNTNVDCVHTQATIRIAFTKMTKEKHTIKMQRYGLFVAQNMYNRHVQLDFFSHKQVCHEEFKL